MLSNTKATNQENEQDLKEEDQSLECKEEDYGGNRLYLILSVWMQRQEEEFQ